MKHDAIEAQRLLDASLSESARLDMEEKILLDKLRNTERELKLLQARKRGINLKQHHLLKERLAIAPMVSDHAVVRYLERICEYDIDAVRDHILDPKTAAMVNFIQHGRVIHGGSGAILIVKNKVVVTVEN